MMKQALFALAAIGALTLAGCDIGMQPKGSSVEDIQKIRASWPPEKQIEGIMQSPMPMDQKRAKIAEIRAKYNLPAEGSETAKPATPGRTP